MNENIPVTFPGLGLSLPVHSSALNIGGFEIKWYGILIAIGLLLAMWYAFRHCKDFHIKPDDLTDIIIISLICGVVGARLYYVIFYPSPYGNPYFQNPISILFLRDGGLGIYGGIVGAFAAAFLVCKKKKISVGAVFDIAGLGFPIGQALGRWGNFFNREAYGAATNAWWRMAGVDPSNVNIGYQPCFLFESIWNIVGFLILHKYHKHRRFNGEVFLLYVMWYGFGRFFIEGLRTDSLMIGNIRVSQLVAAVTFVAALCLIVFKRMKLRQMAADKAAYTPLFTEAARAVEDERKKAEQPVDENNGRPADTQTAEHADKRKDEE
ncbi:MAG: prolipoprotein diacylglyceryl transferase [Ethanoligenens sp.]